MNKPRRESIAKVRAVLSKALEKLEALRDQEEDAMGNIPESMENKIAEAERNVDALETACGQLSDAITSLEEIG